MKALEKLCALLLCFGLLAAATTGCSFFQGNPSSASGSNLLAETNATASMTLIGLSMPGEESEEAETLQALLKEAGYSVEAAYAGGNSDTQLSQVKAMLKDECALLIIDAVDAVAMDAYLDTVNDPTVAVIAYKTCLGNSKVACYLGTDYAAMGKAQADYLVETLELDNEETADKVFTLETVAGESAADARIYQGAMEVLSPYVEAGTLNILSGADTYDAAKTEDAASYLSSVLSNYYAGGTELDAVLTTSNATANGVLTTIDSSYTGSVYPLVTGALCGLESAQWLSDGYLRISTLEPELDLARQAAQVVRQIRTGSQAADVLTEGDILTKDNFQDLLISTGLYAISNTGVVSPGTGADGSATYDEVDTADVDTVEVEHEDETDPASSDTPAAPDAE